MSERIFHTPEMTGEQAFQCMMLARHILKLRISPDGYGMMETTRAVWRRTEEKSYELFEGVLVDEFSAWPNASAMELGVSSTPRGPGEWNDYHFSKRGIAETAAAKGEMPPDAALAEISYWNTQDDSQVGSAENPNVVSYYLGAEQDPKKTIEYRDLDENRIEVTDMKPTRDEGILIIADLMQVLAVAQESGPLA